MFEWLRSKRPNLPSAESEPDRYQGRPMLIILENYVLGCIGNLTAENEARMATVVQRVWPGEGDWKEKVRRALHLEETTDENLRELWSRNSAIARQNGQDLHPVQFAKMIADTNFAPLLER